MGQPPSGLLGIVRIDVAYAAGNPNISHD